MTTQVALQVQLNMDFRVRHSAPGVVQPAVVQSAPDPTAVWRLLRVDDKVSQCHSPPTAANTENSKPFAMRFAKGFLMLKTSTLSHTVTTLSQGGLRLCEALNLHTVTLSQPLYSAARLEQMFAFLIPARAYYILYYIYITYIIYTRYTYVEVYLCGTMDSPEAEK
jgi:hypothetical protein